RRAAAGIRIRARSRNTRRRRCSTLRPDGRAQRRPRRSGADLPMVTALRMTAAGLTRAPGRTLVRVAVLAAAVALLGGMLLFVGNSLRTMSGTTVRSVPLDWQGPVSSYAQATRVAAGVDHQPGILQASAAATARFARAMHR